MMQQGFFVKRTLPLRPFPSLIPRCGACGLLKQCRSPKMTVAGEGRKRILILGEAPGRTEDLKGKPFIGSTGQFLQQTLEKCNIDLFHDCWVTNSLICRPPNNRTPSDKEILYCRPNLLRTLRDYGPDVVIPLGGCSVKSIIGHVWKEECGDIGRWVGWRIPCQRPNVWICPTWHPSYCLREDNATLNMLFTDHLKRATRLRGMPWKEVPDYKSQVRVIYDHEEAATCIDEYFLHKHNPVAFDYETNTIKPDNEDAQILSCALSDGEETISYPWNGNAIHATAEFLQSRVPKIAANGKFELRWTKAKLGIEVNNFAWDTMLAAHVLDNRPDICSLKFQAFVVLGQGDYDSHIDPYRRSKEQGGNAKNRLRDVGLEELLTYGGLDALLEWHLAKKQAKQMGMVI